MACVIHTDRESVAICVACRNEVCEECRSIVEGRNYCPNCQPQPQEQATGPPPEQGAPTHPAAPPPAAAGDSTNQILAALSYPIWIIALIVVVMDSTKKDPYARKHGWTGLFWNIGAFAIWIGVLTLMLLMGAIAAPLAALVGFFVPLYWLAWLVLSVVYAIKAYNRQEFTIPLITDVAAKQYTKPV